MLAGLVDLGDESARGQLEATDWALRNFEARHFPHRAPGPPGDRDLHWALAAPPERTHLNREMLEDRENHNPIFRAKSAAEKQAATDRELSASRSRA
jgi:hypothetical protein